MEIANYIVLDSGDDNLPNLREKNGNYHRYTVNGTTIFPIGSVLPLIVYNERCIGLAMVVECTMRQTSTTVKFQVVETAQDAGYYAEIYMAWALQANLNGEKVSPTGRSASSGGRSNAGNLGFNSRRKSHHRDDDGLTDEDVRNLFR